MPSPYYNPYSGQNFFSFFGVFFVRLMGFVKGDIGYQNLASDEIQLIVLSGVAASSALIGTWLILKKMSMLANSLSHTILLGIVIAFWLTSGGESAAFEHQEMQLHTLLIASLVMGVLTVLATDFFTKVLKLQEDASIGIVFTSFFALGIVLVTVLTKSAHIGIEAVMGNADALHINDCKQVIFILLLNIFLITLCFKEYQITTFDPALAKSLGISGVFFNYLLMLQVSVTTLGAFRAVGVLMVLAFMTGPSLTARLLTQRLQVLLVLSVGIGVAASFVGVALARHFLSVYGIALSTGGVVVCVIAFFFGLAAFWFKTFKMRSRILPDRRDRSFAKGA